MLDTSFANAECLLDGVEINDPFLRRRSSANSILISEQSKQKNHNFLNQSKCNTKYSQLSTTQRTVHEIPKSKNSFSKIYFTISHEIKRDPIKIWRLLALLSLCIGCILLTAVLWFTPLFWVALRTFNRLSNNSISYGFFANLPVQDMDLCINVYNYTNVDAFYDGEEGQLAVDYLGPYCFTEHPKKNGLKFSDDNEQLSYTEGSQFIFNPEKSNGTLEDLVIVPNFPYLVTTTLGTQYNLAIRMVISSYIRSHKFTPFIKLNVSDFFLGYDDPFMDWVVKMAQTVNINVPFERFGLIPAILNFLNVEVVVDTGKSNISHTGRVKYFKGWPKMNFWKTKSCNAFQGGEGTFWDVEEISKDQNLHFFATLLCRNIELRKIGQVEYFDSLMVPRYELIEDMFDNRRPEYGCYCDNCTTNILDIKQCLDGFPFVATYPKFYGVDPIHLSHLKNLPEPDPHGWSTFFDINPKLGVTMRFTQRMQLNLEIKKGLFMTLPNKIENGQILPTANLERNIHRLRPDAEILMYHTLATLPMVEISLKFISIALSIFLTVVIFIYVNKRFNIIS